MKIWYASRIYLVFVKWISKSIIYSVYTSHFSGYFLVKLEIDFVKLLKPLPNLNST